MDDADGGFAWLRALLGYGDMILHFVSRGLVLAIDGDLCCKSMS